MLFRSVDYYNTVRLHSAIGYITPQDKLAGRAQDIFDARERKLAEARERRRLLRQAQQERRTASASDIAMSQGTGSDMPMSPSARPPIDFAAVKASVALAEVLDLLHFTPTTRKGAQQRGPCPVHGSAPAARPSRSFAANLTDNCFHCFKCGAQGNALDLWAKVTKQNIYDAAVDLCRQLGRPVPLKIAPSHHPRNRKEEPVGAAANFATVTLGE